MKCIIKMANKVFYTFLFFVGVVLLFKYFCEWSIDEERPKENVDDFYVIGSSYYDRPNCFKNIFGQKICYPNSYGYPNYYYPYVRGDSTWIRRRPAYWTGSNRIQYWRGH